MSGLAVAARRGVLIKGSAYLEEDRKIRAVALDNTSTLAHGKLVLTDLVPLGSEMRNALVQLAASLDALSECRVSDCSRVEKG